MRGYLSTSRSGCAGSTRRNIKPRSRLNLGIRLAAFGAVALLLLSCNGEPAAAPPTGKSPITAEHTRAPAVAGLFYPGDKAALTRTVDTLLERAPTHYIPRLRALICPHAGYEFSGPIAAQAYKTLAGRDFKTVIILAPSHYTAFAGASIPATDAYQTPLGLVPISPKATTLGASAPFVVEPKTPGERPAWWRSAPKPAPEPGADTPDTWEHSAEVQVPFLQRALKGIQILPVVFGEVDPEAVARGLDKVLDANTCIVASSDLSHYHPYETAKSLDKRCLKAVCDMDVAGMQTQEACGRAPILALMHLARMKGWKPQLLEYRNSGDTSGQKDRVVGYGAVAFYEPGLEEFDAAHRKQLLELARRTLTTVVTNGPVPTIPKDVAPKLAEPRACFVTLTENGQLRGCIGHIMAQEPVWQAVADNTRSAALNDPRFSPLRPSELPKVKIEISVLSKPEPLAFSSPEDLLKKLKPYEDGVLLKIGGRGATFLPQVWAQIPDKTEFLNHLSEKAGCPPGAWRGNETSVAIYHAEGFEEHEVDN